MKRPSRPTARPRPRSAAARPKSRVRSSISITRRSVRRSAAPSALRGLRPGMCVRVLSEQRIDSGAIAVPQQAIQRDAGGGSEVFVVKDDGRVATQPVRTGAVQDGLWLVSEGLKDGDRIIVDGFQKFVPGDKVNAKAWIDASVGAIPGTPAAQASR